MPSAAHCPLSRSAFSNECFQVAMVLCPKFWHICPGQFESTPAAQRGPQSATHVPFERRDSGVHSTARTLGRRPKFCSSRRETTAYSIGQAASLPRQRAAVQHGATSTEHRTHTRRCTCTCTRASARPAAQRDSRAREGRWYVTDCRGRSYVTDCRGRAAASGCT